MGIIANKYGEGGSGREALRKKNEKEQFAPNIDGDTPADLRNITNTAILCLSQYF